LRARAVEQELFAGYAEARASYLSESAEVHRMFAKLHREIWAAMKEEVLKAYAAQKVA